MQTHIHILDVEKYTCTVVTFYTERDMPKMVTKLHSIPVNINVQMTGFSHFKTQPPDKQQNDVMSFTKNGEWIKMTL